MTPLEDAIIFATEAHVGQERKGGGEYILHPLRVMARLTDYTDKIVGVLHDVVEDTPATLQVVQIMFGAEVAEGVDAVTRRKPEGETYGEFVTRAAALPRGARVKFEDILDNLSPDWHDALLLTNNWDEERLLSLQKKYLKSLPVLAGTVTWEESTAYMKAKGGADWAHVAYDHLLKTGAVRTPSP